MGLTEHLTVASPVIVLNLIVLRGPNFRRIGVNPILNVFVGGQRGEAIQCGEDIIRRIRHKSFVCDVSKSLLIDRRTIEAELNAEYPMITGTLA